MVDVAVDLARCSVLVVHNAYKQRGGEDSVVAAEIDLLRRRGHTVHIYARSNDEIDDRSRLLLAAETLWSKRTVRELTKEMHESTPAIVHVHNTLPLISPSVYWVAKRMGVPVVQTLHNYRLLCPQGLMLRNDRPCMDCVGRMPWPAVQHHCYRGSLAQSAVVASMLQLHRDLGTWGKKVQRYIALTEFSRQLFVQGGLPAERISIKPNFVDLPRPESLPRTGFLFVGRVSAEKGIETLASAMAITRPTVRLRAIGVGPQLSLLQAAKNVELLGLRSRQEVFSSMKTALALVVPSIWHETFGLVVVEAYACGLPVIASRIGSLASLVKHGVTGLLVEPGDPNELARALEWAVENPGLLARMGEQAREFFESEFTADKNYEILSKIYESAIRSYSGVADIGRIDRE